MQHWEFRKVCVCKRAVTSDIFVSEIQNKNEFCLANRKKIKIHIIFGTKMSLVVTLHIAACVVLCSTQFFYLHVHMLLINLLICCILI